jgi:hypothetical protein
MAKRTQLFQLMPWLGGRNTTLDPAILEAGQLSIADNTLFSTDMARRKRPGFAYLDSSSIGASVVLQGLIDYWANVASVKTQRIVGVTSEPAIYSYTSAGTRTALTKHSTATALVAGFSYVSMEVINEDLIIAFDNATSPKKWDNQSGTEWKDLAGSPPNFAFSRGHKNRLFAAGVKANPDRLYYSSVDNHEEWNGAGTSGAIDIKPGDGDPEGITAIFPTIKGALFVAKRDRLYRVDTTSADDADWSVTEVSAGIGCAGHNLVAAVGQDDVVYVSDKGVHALSTTAAYGDFVASFLSKNTQKEMNDWNKARFKAMQLCYVPEISSVVIAVSPEGFGENAELHLYNVDDKGWYRFPDIYAGSICRAKLDSRDVLLMGNNAGRLSQLTNNTINDYGAAIPWRVKTGVIYPDGSPKTVKGFKKLSLFYKPKLDSTITAKFKIDNYAEQSLSFDIEGEYDLLGSTFVLGSSVLGLQQALPAVTLPVDGYGRGFSLELSQSAVDQDVEIYGFAVEYEAAGDKQESVELS